MATSRNDPRIIAAIDRAMAWMKNQVGRANAKSIWSIAYPAWANTGYAWCGGFQVAAFKATGGPDLMKCAWWFYTPYILNFAKKIGAWKTSGQNYGDEPLFDWNLDGTIDHVGASYPDPSAAAFRSIEGNTSPGTAGSQSNGGGAWIRYRTKPTLRGWVDMRTVLAYMIDKGLWKPGTVDKPLSDHTISGNQTLVVDGYWGPATTRALQRINKTPIDGVVSQQPSAHRNLLGGVSGWEFVSNPKDGSLLVKAMQRAFRVPADGFYGPRTIRAMQVYYGTLVDGKISSGGSSVVVAMQRAINRQLARG